MVLENIEKQTTMNLQIIDQAPWTTDYNEKLRNSSQNLEFLFYIGPVIIHNKTIDGQEATQMAMKMSGITKNKDSGLGQTLDLVKKLSVLLSIFTFIPIMIIIGLLNIHFPVNTKYFLQIFLNLVFKSSPGENEPKWEDS